MGRDELGRKEPLFSGMRARDEGKGWDFHVRFPELVELAGFDAPFKTKGLASIPPFPNPNWAHPTCGSTQKAGRTQGGGRGYDDLDS